MTSSSTPFDLERFVIAQDPLFSEILIELENGEKESCWMWFVFPQLAGLGRSPTSKYYEIRSMDEAKSYLTHPVLGGRLKRCCQILLGLKNVPVWEVFDPVDEEKLHASMTLFSSAAEDGEVFDSVLKKLFSGKAHEKTLTAISIQ